MTTATHSDTYSQLVMHRGITRVLNGHTCMQNSELYAKSVGFPQTSKSTQQSMALKAQSDKKYCSPSWLKRDADSKFTSEFIYPSTLPAVSKLVPFNCKPNKSNTDPLTSPTPVHFWNLERAFAKLVKEAGVHSTAAIFIAVSSSWEALRLLETVCPAWASYTGSTSTSNRIFHRSQLQSESSLVRLFSYYALLDEVRATVSNSLSARDTALQEEKILDALVLLDAMRARFETSADPRAVIFQGTPSTHPNNDASPSTAAESDCISIASEGSGFSLLISEDEDEGAKQCREKMNFMITAPATASFDKPIQRPKTYSSMSRDRLKNQLTLPQFSDILDSHRRQSETLRTQVLVDPPGIKNQVVGAPLFKEAVGEILEAVKNVDLQLPKNAISPTQRGHFEEQVATDPATRPSDGSVYPIGESTSTAASSSCSSSSRAVSELVEFLDQIREALQTPERNDEKLGKEKNLEENPLNSSLNLFHSRGINQSSDMVLRSLGNTTDNTAVSNDKGALSWIDLATLLSETTPENSRSDIEFSTPAKSKRRSSHSYLITPAKTGKRRRTTSPTNQYFKDGSLTSCSQVVATGEPSGDSQTYSAADLATPCPGVCWDPTHMRWVAHWSDAKTHQRVRKYFNPKLLGFERARLLAVLTRKEAVDSGCASMMVKADRPKLSMSTGIHSMDSGLDASNVVPSDDPFDRNYIKGVYYSAADKCWYAHFKPPQATEIKVEAFPVADFLVEANYDENRAMTIARAKATQYRKTASCTNHNCQLPKLDELTMSLSEQKLQRQMIDIPSLSHSFNGPINNLLPDLLPSDIKLSPVSQVTEEQLEEPLIELCSTSCATLQAGSQPLATGNIIPKPSVSLSGTQKTKMSNHVFHEEQVAPPPIQQLTTQSVVQPIISRPQVPNDRQANSLKLEIFLGHQRLSSMLQPVAASTLESLDEACQAPWTSYSPVMTQPIAQQLPSLNQPVILNQSVM